MLRQIPWLALQGAIIVGTMALSYAASDDPVHFPVMPILLIGIVLAFTATAMLVAWIECYKAFRRWLSKPARIDPASSHFVDDSLTRSAVGNSFPRTVEHRSGSGLKRT